MADPVCFLHVGLPKTGTTMLQSLLAARRDELAAQGVLYPFVRPEGMFHAAVEVVQWQHWGLDPRDLAGTWAAHCAQVRAHAGRSVISHEVLGRARRRQAVDALAGLEGVEVHLVVTARDLARQVTATWQERIKNGRRYSFEEFVAREGVLPGPDGEREGPFWREQDLPAVLRRWGRDLPPDRVHVVTVPPPGADPLTLVRRFGEVVGVDLAGVAGAEGASPLLAEPANRSLSSTQAELLRQVNIRLEGRLEGADYVREVKRGFTVGPLARVAGPQLLAPSSLRRPLEEVADRWREELAGRGYAVHGDLDDLVPRAFGGSRPSSGPSQERPSSREAAEVLADLLVALGQMVPNPPTDDAYGTGVTHVTNETRRSKGLRSLISRWSRA